jgi:hypothetical protein
MRIVVGLILLRSFFFLAFSGLGNCQQHAEEPHLSVRTDPQYSLRIISVYFNGHHGIKRSCAIVYPDGSFHSEHSQQDISEQHPHSYYAFEGTLTSDESKAIADLLADQALTKHQNRPLASGNRLIIAPDSRLLSAEIPRDRYFTQNVVTNIGQEKPSSEVKLLVDFLDAISARDRNSVHDAKADNCKAPSPRAVPRQNP